MSYDPLWRPIPGTGQNLTIGVASVASTAFSAYAIRITTSGDCHITLGTGTPAAVGTDLKLKASDPAAFLRVAPGEKLAVIQDAAATGTLNIVEITH